MSFRLFLSPKSRSFLDKLDSEESNRIEKKLKHLKNNSELGKPMVGKLAGLWSLRVGKYRALYQIRKNELLVLVLRIDHRKKVYV